MGACHPGVPPTVTLVAAGTADAFALAPGAAYGSEPTGAWSPGRSGPPVRYSTQSVRPFSPVWQCTFLPEPALAWTPSGDASAREKSSLKNGMTAAQPGRAQAKSRGSHAGRIGRGA
jgi:hypothetical protein